MRSWRRGLILLLLTLPGCYRGQLAVAGPEGCGERPGERVAELVNAIRAEGGRGPLAVDLRLMAAAERHSADMARFRFMGHTGHDGSSSEDRALGAGYDIGSVGEVVAAGHRTPEAVVQGWLRSRRHREILLLADVVTIGAACAPSGRGALYWTAVVGQRWTVADDGGGRDPEP